MSIVRKMLCRSLLRVRKKKAKKVCLGPWYNLCGVQREFRFLPKERCFQPKEKKKSFDESSTLGSGSSFQVPSLSGPVTSQEQGSPVSPQFFFFVHPCSKSLWDGVIGLWGRVAPFLSPWCGKKDVPTGVNLNQYAGSGSFIRWHSDNEPLFGPQNLPKLIVSLSLGNSVEFKVRRRASGNFPSSIRLDHGDVLVMDGLAQSEYEHCTASELQGPRINLTYRGVAQDTASCPLAGVVGCVLPTCAQGLVEPNARWLGEGENRWSSFWGDWSSFC